MSATPLVRFRAGRCVRRAGMDAGRWVDPQPARGLVELRTDEGLLHFQWRDIDSDSLVDDLILFPGDATFHPVTSATSGRVYVLRFTSSSARHFYWLQDVSTDKDAWNAARVNQLIDDPDASEGDLQVPQSTSSNAAASTSGQTGEQESMQTDEQQQSSGHSQRAVNATAAGSSTQAAANSGAGASNVTADQMAALRQLLQQSASTEHGGVGLPSSLTSAPSVSLGDILSPARLLSLLSASPTLAEELYAYLPPASDVVPHNLETIRRILNGQEVRRSARGLDQALQSGALGPLSVSLGLTEEETFGVDAYLRGVQRLGDEQRRQEEGRNPDFSGSMQTD